MNSYSESTRTFIVKNAKSDEYFKSQYEHYKQRAEILNNALLLEDSKDPKHLASPSFRSVLLNMKQEVDTFVKFCEENKDKEGFSTEQFAEDFGNFDHH